MGAIVKPVFWLGCCLFFSITVCRGEFLPNDGGSTSIVGSLLRLLFDVSSRVPLRGATDTQTPYLNLGTYDDYGDKKCFCAPGSFCPQPNNAGSINVRIVTPSRYCPPGYVSCCNDNTSNKCGTRFLNRFPENRGSLQNGEAPRGAYPWQVLILDRSNRFIGSGALIDSQFVVTAAHKVSLYNNRPDALKLRLGDWNVYTENESFRPVERDVSQMTIHPQFNMDTVQYDIAILKLSTPVFINNATPHINTVCLPQLYDIFAGQRCYVSGWGQNEFGPDGSYQSTQKAVDVIVQSDSECERLLRQTRLGPFYRFDSFSFLCAGGEEDKDACKGDGGAPLVCERGGGRFYLAGLVAWGIGCGNPGVPGVYVNIRSFVLWINQQILYLRNS